MDLTGRRRPPVDAAVQQPAGDGPRRSLPRRSGWLAVLLCAAWLVPLALNLLRLDIVELVLLLVAVASMLRSGTNIVDRLMLAGCLLASGFLAFGLLSSVWPLGLGPIPVAGTLGSVVVLAGWLSGRRPRLPRRVLGSDIVVLGSGLFAFWAVYAPVARLSAVRRLTFSAHTSDRFLHFARFDTILRLGGYPFLQEHQAQVSIKGATLVDYPSGSHFLYAVFDTFRQSGAGAGPALQEYNRYFIYILAAYAFLVTAIVWAARWIAGPRVTGWRIVAVCSLVAGLVIGGTFARIVGLGLDSQTLGLAFFAIAVAVNARPPHVVSEQVLVWAALPIAVAYCYEPYLPMAGLGLVLAGMVYLRRLRRHWRFSAGVLAIGWAIAIYPSVLTAASGFSTKAQLLGHGGWVVVPPQLMYGCVVIASVATVALSLMWRPVAVPRAMAGQLLAAGVVLSGFAAYQLYEVHQIRYYYYKLDFAGYVACLVSLGLLGVILCRISFPFRLFQPAGRLGRRLRELSLAAAAGTAALLVMVAVQPRWPTAGSPPVWGGTSLQQWYAGQVKSGDASTYATLADAHLLADGVPTLIVSGHPAADRYDSFLAAVLNRNMGEMGPALTAYTARAVYYRPIGPRTSQLEIAAMRLALTQTPAPVRVVVASPALANDLRLTIAGHPGLKDTMIVVLPSLY